MNNVTRQEIVGFNPITDRCRFADELPGAADDPKVLSPDTLRYISDNINKTSIALYQDLGGRAGLGLHLTVFRKVLGSIKKKTAK